MGTREYILNNSSTVLKENFLPEQIDVMVAQLNFDKLRNAGLRVFADANSHFNVLAHTTGGYLAPYTYTHSAATATPRDIETLI
mgnify:CR=1 FL=1